MLSVTKHPSISGFFGRGVYPAPRGSLRMTLNDSSFALIIATVTVYCYYFHMQTDSKELTHLIVGYSLIAIGILVMLMSCWQVYRIFTKQSEPIRFFSFPGIKIDLSQIAPKVDTSSLDALKHRIKQRSCLQRCSMDPRIWVFLSFSWGLYLTSVRELRTLAQNS